MKMKYWHIVPICLGIVICFQSKGLSSMETPSGKLPSSLNEEGGRDGVEPLSIKPLGNNKGDDSPPLGLCTRYGPQPTDELEDETEEQTRRTQLWLSQVNVGTIDDEFLPRPQRLRHISGITASPGYGDAGVYWVGQNVAVSEEEEISSGGRHRHYITNTLHAINTKGQVLAKITLNMGNYDWEDLGAFYDKTDGKNKLVVFDTGEHDFQRNPGPGDPFCRLGGELIPGTLRARICGGRTDDIAPPATRLLVIDEPNLDGALDREEGLPPLDLGTITPTTHEMIYPDVNRTRCYGEYGGGDPFRCNEEQIARFYIHDTEAGVIDPSNGMVILFGKQYPLNPSEDERADARMEGREVNNQSYVYTLPASWRSDEVNELEKIDRQLAPETTGGAGVRYDGRCVVIRTGHEAEEYCKVNPEDSLEDMFRLGNFRRTHIDLCDPNNCGRTMEFNGEAINYTADGSGLITTSKHYRFRDPADDRLEHPNPPPPEIRVYQCTQWEQ